jgi:hypothetical protein
MKSSPLKYAILLHFAAAVTKLQAQNYTVRLHSPVEWSPSSGALVACDHNAPVSSSYQWLMNGQPIYGAIKPTILINRPDDVKHLTCRVTPPVGAGEPVLSAPAELRTRQAKLGDWEVSTLANPQRTVAAASDRHIRIVSVPQTKPTNGNTFGERSTSGGAFAEQTARFGIQDPGVQISVDEPGVHFSGEGKLTKADAGRALVPGVTAVTRVSDWSFGQSATHNMAPNGFSVDPVLMGSTYPELEELQLTLDIVPKSGVVDGEHGKFLEMEVIGSVGNSLQTSLGRIQVGTVPSGLAADHWMNTTPGHLVLMGNVPGMSIVSTAASGVASAAAAKCSSWPTGWQALGGNGGFELSWPEPTRISFPDGSSVMTDVLTFVPQGPRTVHHITGALFRGLGLQQVDVHRIRQSCRKPFSWGASHNGVVATPGATSRAVSRFSTTGHEQLELSPSSSVDACSLQLAFDQDVDSASFRVVEKATSGLKDTLKTQVRVMGTNNGQPNQPQGVLSVDMDDRAAAQPLKVAVDFAGLRSPLHRLTVVTPSGAVGLDLPNRQGHVCHVSHLPTRWGKLPGPTPCFWLEFPPGATVAVATGEAGVPPIVRDAKEIRVIAQPPAGFVTDGISSIDFSSVDAGPWMLSPVESTFRRRLSSDQDADVVVAEGTGSLRDGLLHVSPSAAPRAALALSAFNNGPAMVQLEITVGNHRVGEMVSVEHSYTVTGGSRSRASIRWIRRDLPPLNGLPPGVPDLPPYAIRFDTGSGQPGLLRILRDGHGGPPTEVVVEIESGTEYTFTGQPSHFTTTAEGMEFTTPQLHTLGRQTQALGFGERFIFTDPHASTGDFTPTTVHRLEVASTSAKGLSVHVIEAGGSAPRVLSPRDAASGLATGRRSHSPLSVTLPSGATEQTQLAGSLPLCCVDVDSDGWGDAHLGVTAAGNSGVEIDAADSDAVYLAFRKGWDGTVKGSGCSFTAYTERNGSPQVSQVSVLDAATATPETPTQIVVQETPTRPIRCEVKDWFGRTISLPAATSHTIQLSSKACGLRRMGFTASGSWVLGADQPMAYTVAGQTYQARQLILTCSSPDEPTPSIFLNGLPPGTRRGVIKRFAVAVTGATEGNTIMDELLLPSVPRYTMAQAADGSGDTILSWTSDSVFPAESTLLDSWSWGAANGRTYRLRPGQGRKFVQLVNRGLPIAPTVGQRMLPTVNK